MARSIAETIAATKASWALSRAITVPERIEPRPAAPGKLRIAFLIYRGNPRCGGQGVYTRHLTRELVALGHSVEVFARALASPPYSASTSIATPTPFAFRRARSSGHSLTSPSSRS